MKMTVTSEEPTTKTVKVQYIKSSTPDNWLDNFRPQATPRNAGRQRRNKMKRCCDASLIADAVSFLTEAGTLTWTRDGNEAKATLELHLAKLGSKTVALVVDGFGEIETPDAGFNGVDDRVVNQ